MQYLRSGVQGWDQLSCNLDQEGTKEMRHQRRYLEKLIIWRKKKRRQKGDNRYNWEGVEVQLIPCLPAVGQCAEHTVLSMISNNSRKESMSEKWIGWN